MREKQTPTAAASSAEMSNQLLLHKNKYSRTPMPAKEMREAMTVSKKTTSKDQVISGEIPKDFTRHTTLSI